MKQVPRGDKTEQWWRYGIAPEHLRELSVSDRRNAKSLNHWFLVWLVVVFVGVIGSEPLLGNVEVAIAWRVLLAFSGIAATVLLIRAYLHFYRETKDELIRKVHHDSLCIGFGVAFFLGVCFVIAEPLLGQTVKAGPLLWAGMIIAYFVSYGLLIRKNHYA